FFAGRDVPGSAWEEPERDEHQLVQGVAHPRHAIRTRPAFIRTRGGCSYNGLAPVGAPPSVRTGASTFSHPGRVLLPRFHSCRSTALGASRPPPAARTRPARAAARRPPPPRRRRGPGPRAGRGPAPPPARPGPLAPGAAPRAPPPARDAPQPGSAPTARGPSGTTGPLA